MPDYVEEVKRITGGEGAWGGLDPIAGENTSKMLSSIRPKGTVYVYGKWLPVKYSTNIAFWIKHYLWTLEKVTTHIWSLNCFWAQKSVEIF